MAIEIIDNLDPKKASHLDDRLTTVANVASLPDLTIASNFLYEGATIYIINSYFRPYDYNADIFWYDIDTKETKQISHNNDVKIILIAGPTSSGKTSFAKRLSILKKPLRAFSNSPAR